MTFLVEFLGCKVNSYEVEALANDLIARGDTLFDAKKDKEPDLIIINTCAVTHTSIVKDKKVIKRYRKLYPNAILVVMGCYSQYKGEYILNELDADIVLGTSKRDRVIEFVDKFKENHQKIYFHEEHNNIRQYEEIKLTNFLFNTRAYVKIQDGCNNFCSYCLIPYVRGRSRSRNSDEIVVEIKNLIKNGFKEVVLTGIDMSSYGLDLTPKCSLGDLVEKILVECKDLYRLRISSLEESLLDDKFISLFGRFPNLANHLHIPLQSGSEKIVKLMNRKYNLDAFYDKVTRLREIRPDISITTDVIVGFPEENEQDFLDTYNFCKKINFSKIHVFPFSPREGTVAAKMKNQVKENDKKDRVHRLISLSDTLEREYEAKFYDQDIEFLFEEHDKVLDGYKGHSSNYLECFYKTKEDIKGQLKTINFTKENSLFFDNVKK